MADRWGASRHGANVVPLRASMDPALSNTMEINNRDFDLQQITFRYQMRQFQYELLGRVENLERNVMTALNQVNREHNERLDKITGAISEIKAIHDEMAAQYKEIKKDNNPIGTWRSHMEVEYMMAEVQERIDRKKNLVIYGIPECFVGNDYQRHIYDYIQVMGVLRAATSECPAPVAMARLGKSRLSGMRLIKVRFQSPEAAALIFRNRERAAAAIPTIKIYADDTPHQNQYANKLREEMNRRIRGGEKDLIIKYLHGIPRIVRSQSRPRRN